MHDEQWRAVPQFEGLYEVSDHGRVRSLPRMIGGKNGPRRWKGGMLNPRLDKGYPKARLCNFGAYKDVMVHRLVAAVFIGPRPEGFVTHHRNGVKTDNRVSNLKYITPEANSIHAWRTGLCDGIRGENHYRAVLTEAMIGNTRRRLAEGEKIRTIAEDYGVKPGTLRQGAAQFGGTWAALRNAQREESAS